MALPPANVQIETLEFNETKYTTTKFLGRRATRLYSELSRDFLEVINTISNDGSAISSLVSQQGDGNDANNIAGVNASIMFAKAFLSFSANKDPDAYQALIMRLLETTTANGKALSLDSNFDNHFCGKIGELHAVIFFVIKTNFPDFFSSMKSVTSGFLG